jgi:hypothetical protein
MEVMGSYMRHPKSFLVPPWRRTVIRVDVFLSLSRVRKASNVKALDIHVGRCMHHCIIWLSGNHEIEVMTLNIIV